MKKIISILLVFVMLISCFSMVTSAAVNDAVLKVEFKVKEIVDNVVTFEVWLEQTAEIGTIGAFDALYIGYDSRVFEDIDSLQDNVAKNWDQQSTVITDGYPCDNNFAKGSDSWITKNPTGCKPNDADLARGWDTVLWFSMIPDGTDDDYSSPAACLAFKLKLKDDAPADGCYNVGICNSSIVGDVQTQINEELGAFGGASGADLGFTTTNVFELVEATVAKPASSFIKDGGAQIRFRGIGSTGTVDDYQGEFDVRTVATISQDDFVANFGSDENAIAKITDIGFVYATAANVPTFDLATAKAVAEGTASEGYVKKAVQSIQHAGDGEVYKFTCLIENIADADKEQTVNALAYVCFDGTYYYFDAAATVDFAALYERMPK